VAAAYQLWTLNRLKTVRLKFRADGRSIVRRARVISVLGYYGRSRVIHVSNGEFRISLIDRKIRVSVHHARAHLQCRDVNCRYVRRGRDLMQYCTTNANARDVRVTIVCSRPRPVSS